MKSFSIIVSVLSMAAASNALALGARSLFERQANCRIYAPQLVQAKMADLATQTAFNFQATNDFHIEGSSDPAHDVLTLASFDIPNDGTSGPCDLRFFFYSPSLYATSGGSVLNVYAPQQGTTALESPYLLGTVNLDANTNYPKTVEINSVVCPANGKLLLAFEGLNGEAVKFDQYTSNGLFVFKGDCYGQPAFAP